MNLGVNEILLIVLVALNVILVGIVIYLGVRYKKIERSYAYFMKGKDAESLEDHIISLTDRVTELEIEDSQNKEAIRMLNKMQRSSYQKSGIIHYNAFKGMGGNLSFAAALLDYTNSGFVINSVHSREGCYVYVKIVDRGKTEVLLGNEEQAALEQALGYIQREDV